MGNQQCCSPAQTVPDLVCYDFVMGEDNNEEEIDHETDIECHHHQIRKNLEICCAKLKQSRRLFKDKQMSTKPVVLKSTAGDNEVRCTYQRPYVFLEDSNVTRGSKYRILDYLGHRPQQIIVKDEVMQSLGVFLCFLSERNSLILKVVSTESNNYGMAVIHTNSQGSSNFVYIDDYILCCDKKPFFTQPIEGTYMWPCLIEKAWLKIKRNMHNNIQKFSASQVFQTFLSYPIKTYVLSNDKEECRGLLKKTIHAIQPEMGCFVTSKKDPGHKLGLSGRQHFYLIKTFEFESVNMYYLRNPCGAFDYRGAYHIIEAPLLQKLQKLSGLASIGEGDFVMDEQQFMEQIEEFSIVHYKKKSDVVSTIPIRLDVEVEEYVKLEIKNKQKGLVSLHLEQNKLCQHAVTYQIMDLKKKSFVSGRINEEGCFAMKCINLLDQPFAELQPGEYLIRLKKKLIPNHLISKQKPNQSHHDLLIVTAGSPAVLTPLSDPSQGKSIFTQCLTNLGRTHLQQNPPSDPLQIDAHHTALQFGDLFIIYVQKKNPDKEQIQLQVCLSEVTNLKCISHPIGRDYSVIKNVRESVLIVLEKVELAAETVLSKYVIEPF